MNDAEDALVALPFNTMRLADEQVLFLKRMSCMSFVE